MFDQPATQLSCDQRLAGHGNLLRPLAVDPDAVAARAGKRQIDQFDLESLSGFMINEFERIMRVWG